MNTQKIMVIGSPEWLLASSARVNEESLIAFLADLNTEIKEVLSVYKSADSLIKRNQRRVLPGDLLAEVQRARVTRAQRQQVLQVLVPAQREALCLLQELRRGRSSQGLAELLAAFALRLPRKALPGARNRTPLRFYCVTDAHVETAKRLLSAHAEMFAPVPKEVVESARYRLFRRITSAMTFSKAEQQLLAAVFGQ